VLDPPLQAVIGAVDEFGRHLRALPLSGFCRMQRGRMLVANRAIAFTHQRLSHSIYVLCGEFIVLLAPIGSVAAEIRDGSQGRTDPQRGTSSAPDCAWRSQPRVADRPRSVVPAPSAHGVYKRGLNIQQ
jgi:hypothetical protein